MEEERIVNDIILIASAVAGMGGLLTSVATLLRVRSTNAKDRGDGVSAVATGAKTLVDASSTLLQSLSERVDELEKERETQNKTIKELREEVAGFKRIKDSLEAQILGFQSTEANLQLEREILKDRIKALEEDSLALRERNRFLVKIIIDNVRGRREFATRVGCGSDCAVIDEDLYKKIQEIALEDLQQVTEERSQ